ncbi:MAG: hypothetical protein F9K40_10430 [Kofleriaceae bacterium]|nr:MAG: hypothetical protein F9K40_10430 [Kofleriaceae bacterium]
MPADSDLAQALTRRVAAAGTDAKHTVKDSVAVLMARRAALENTASVYDLAEAVDADPSLRAIAFHFDRVRAALAYELWGDQIFLGASILDDLLLHALREPAETDPVGATIRRIYAYGIHHPGFVVYPIHSLALYGVGLLQGADVRFALKPYGLLITPQTRL